MAEQKAIIYFCHLLILKKKTLRYSYIIGNCISFTSFIGKLQLEINMISPYKFLNIAVP